jgi:putative transposase
MMGRHSARKWDERGRASLPFRMSRHSAESTARRGRRALPFMNIGRKHLPHEGGPLFSANPEGEVYFITICCVPRGANQLARPDVWNAIDETLSHREATGDLRCGPVLAMPDHLHALMAFPGPADMRIGIRGFKSWLAKQHGIRWQRDFFDHRLRNWESGAEKAQYIRMNPVRAGLVTRPEDWPYQR